MGSALLLFVPYLFLFLSVLFLAGIVWLAVTNKGKGVSGEETVSYFLNKLDKEEYFVINDIILKVGTNTAQIDHIVVSKYGIFVIETKNWSGSVYGSSWGKELTQYIWGNKYIHQNPIRQNSTHIRRLREVFSDYPNLKYISIVAFSGNTKRKIKDDKTIKISEILDTIGKHKEVAISEVDRDSVYEKLKSLKIEGKNYREEHDENVRRVSDK